MRDATETEKLVAAVFGVEVGHMIEAPRYCDDGDEGGCGGKHRECDILAAVKRIDDYVAGRLAAQGDRIEFIAGEVKRSISAAAVVMAIIALTGDPAKGRILGLAVKLQDELDKGPDQRIQIRANLIVRPSDSNGITL